MKKKPWCVPMLVCILMVTYNVNSSKNKTVYVIAKSPLHRNVLL